MGQELFYVSQGGHQHGPISISEIVDRINKNTLTASDYIFDEHMQDWVMLIAHPQLVEHLKTVQPPPPPPHLHLEEEKKNPDPDGYEWFVLKGDNKFGPFPFVEIVRMLQEKTVKDSDYVWNSKLPGWEKISALEDFSPETIRNLRNSGVVSLNEVFFRRRHARVQYGASVIIHNFKHVFNAKCTEISAGGASFVIANDGLHVGERIFLHFTPGEGLPPFHAHCEVMSKRAVSSGDATAPVRYGVKFTVVSKGILTKIDEMAVQAGPAKAA